MSDVALYASVGAELAHYSVDVDAATLTRAASVTLPANVQYAWPHRSRHLLYVASSDSAPGMGRPGTNHRLSALAIDRSSGALTPHGAPVPLPTRPIHLTTDIPSEHVLVAFNNPAGLRVYRIADDGSPGQEIAQPGVTDPGIFPHQIRVTPDNRIAILVARGHDAEPGKAEQPGALKTFAWKDGSLSNESTVAPHGGYGFGPRHLDFHPAKPWVYLSLERQNQLAMFTMESGILSPAATFIRPLLSRPRAPGVSQLAGTVHVHPDGRTVYVANRAPATAKAGEPFAGGENTIAVFRIDEQTGEPALIQHVDTQGIHCRTFHIDPSGRLLVGAHIMGMAVKSEDGEAFVPARLSLFRIADDGMLTFARAYDVDVGDRLMFWMGMVAL